MDHSDIRETMIWAGKVLVNEGQDDFTRGHISFRLPDDPSRFLMKCHSVGLDEITMENILTIDLEGNVVAGTSRRHSEVYIHSEIFKVRPDVNCIIHTHPLHVASLSMLEVPLEVSHMDNCPLYGDVAFLKDWPGVPVGNEEGEIISKALGSKRAILLSHHGMLIAAGSVEEACVLALQFERAARMQLLAMAAGKIQPIPPELVPPAERPA